MLGIKILLHAKKLNIHFKLSDLFEALTVSQLNQNLRATYQKRIMAINSIYTNDLLSICSAFSKTIHITLDTTLGSIGISSKNVNLFIEKINEKFYKSFNVNDINTKQKVYDVLLLLTGNQGRNNTHDCLVNIAKAASTRNLIMIHAGGGSIHPYLPFSKLLKDVNIFGINNPFLFDNYPSDIHGFARHYLDVLKKGKLLDNLILCGWSFGGIIAYELGSLLKKLGIHVQAIILIDSFAPNFSQNIISYAESVDEDKDNPMISDTLMQDVNEFVNKLSTKNSALSTEYLPPKYDSSFFLIKAMEKQYQTATHFTNNGWESYIQEMKSFVVSGNHNQLFDKGRIEEVTSVIADIIHTLEIRGGNENEEHNY